MNIVQTAIPGIYILAPRLYGDSRGYFFESYSHREFAERVCRTVFVQDNESRSRYGVVRG
ncbi:MAG: dTDP-4-dehydrorhamnose 3,5-epimerase family protein, partial [Rikenellaceae bacterium]|nr:dTDP-4-dehydrorhamnose 3,5-epimerase family protein [Rikenellaceae bacterium]